MAASAVLLAKAAAIASTDKRGRTALLSLAAAVLLPFILVVFLLLSFLDGTTTHNVSAVDLTFHGGTLSAEVPEEYREYIEDIRRSFGTLDALIAGVDNLEGGEIDANRVKSYFYAIYFGEEQPSRRAQREFLDCFLRYEERTRVVENEDGTTREETYVVAIFLTDQNEIQANLSSFLEEPLADEDRFNAQRIYTIAVYGRVEPGSLEAGPAMGEEGYEALIREAVKYIGYPYVWGGSSPATSFDCSGYICYIFTHSGVTTLPRTSAGGLYSQCAVIPREEAQPGDLVFFTGTYASAGPVSHVGLYVGNGKMLHAGNPIGYADLNSSYWRSHYYATGRLPGIS